MRLKKKLLIQKKHFTLFFLTDKCRYKILCLFKKAAPDALKSKSIFFYFNKTI
jgi:hypothetical protein